MLHKFEVSGVHTNLSEDIQKYVDKKIGTLDRFIPKHARNSAHAEVHLKRNKTGTSKFICNITIYLPHQTLSVHECADSFEAAIDVAAQTLKQQIHKYKEMYANGKLRRHLVARLAKAS